MPTLENVDGGTLAALPGYYSMGVQAGAAGTAARASQLNAMNNRRKIKQEGERQEAGVAAQAAQMAERRRLTDEVFAGKEGAMQAIIAADPQYGKLVYDVKMGDDKAAAAKLDEMSEKGGALALSAMNTSNPTIRRQMYMTEAKTFMDAGDEPAAKNLMEMANLAVNDPERFEAEANQDILLSKNTKLIDLANIGSGSKVESLPAEVVAFNDLIKDFTPEQKKTARLVKAGLKGRAMSNAELSAIEAGTIKNYGEWKANQKQAEKFAEMTGSSRAKTIDKGYDRIMTINSGIGSIDRAIKAVESGAGTGAVEKLLPSIKAASVELDQLRNQMALDVISGVTLGAISEGELALVQQVALPTGLNGPELIKHLKDRKQAQEKLRDYFKEQIDFLDQGGTVAGFVRQKEREMQGQGSGSTQINDNTFTSSSGVTFTVK